MINLQEYCNENLVKSKNYFKTTIVSNISYPKDGNDTCCKLEDNSFWFKHRNNCILQFLKKIKINGPLFDIGGGNGFVASFLQRNGLSVVMVEPGEVGCSNAFKRGLTYIINGSFKDCFFKDNSIPAAGLFDVLEHIENDQDFLRDVYQKIIPGGYVIFTVPAHQFLWSQEDVDAGHYRRYCSSQLRQLLEEAKFEVITINGFFSFLFFPIFFIRVLPYFLRHRPVISSEKTLKLNNNSCIINFILSILYKIDLWQSKKIKFGTSLLVIGKK